MNKGSRVFVAGHRGLVGSAVLRELRKAGYSDLVIADSKELDLRSQVEVEKFFSSKRLEIVILAAAKVGGIHANATYPVEFLRDNLQIQTNVIDAAWRHGVSKLCFLGSSCIYPKLAPQPISEDALLTGPLESTNEWYAVAKIAGIKLCQAYRRQYGFNAISLMPTNLYGPGDNFDAMNSHVLPALIRRFHEAKIGGADVVTVWGTGSPRREFLHIEDLARAVVFLTQVFEGEDLVNVGCGEDVSIGELAELVARVVGFSGRIEFDASKPDGTPRKLLNVSRLTGLGWRPQISLEEGLRSTYDWYVRNLREARH
jgi:GDP-L-fucose synthase